MAIPEAINLSYGIDYALELRDGGQGVALQATSTASAPVAHPGKGGDVIAVCNDGENAIWFRLGAADVQATLASTPILAGTKEIFTIPRDGGDYGYISVISRVGESTVTANFGRGS